MVKITDLLRNMGNGARVATALLAVGGIVFQTGRISQNVDDLVPRIHALESKDQSMQNTLYDIHGQTSAMIQKVDILYDDVKDIKQNLSNKK